MPPIPCSVSAVPGPWKDSTRSRLLKRSGVGSNPIRGATPTGPMRGKHIPADHPLQGSMTRVDQVLGWLSGLFNEWNPKEDAPRFHRTSFSRAGSRWLCIWFAVSVCSLSNPPAAFCGFVSWTAIRMSAALTRRCSPTTTSGCFRRMRHGCSLPKCMTSHWTSNQHFTADGTRVEAWAGMKSFVSKDQEMASPIIRSRTPRCRHSGQRPRRSA
jgi:hypothetical protein